MINEAYLKSIAQIKSTLARDGVIVLYDFLKTLDKTELQAGKLLKNFNLTSHSYMCAAAKVSPKLNRFIADVAGKKPKKWEMRVFSHRDYSIINDSNSAQTGFEAIIDLTDNWQDSWGGSVVYVDGTGDYLRIPPRLNCLSLAVMQKRHRFIEYVNHNALKQKRKLLVAEF